MAKEAKPTKVCGSCGNMAQKKHKGYWYCFRCLREMGVIK